MLRLWVENCLEIRPSHVLVVGGLMDGFAKTQQRHEKCLQFVEIELRFKYTEYPIPFGSFRICKVTCVDQILNASSD